MSGNFEKAMADIAVKAAQNGGPGNGDILTAIKAVKEDHGEESIDELMQLLKHFNK